MRALLYLLIITFLTFGTSMAGVNIENANQENTEIINNTIQELNKITLQYGIDVNDFDINFKIKYFDKDKPGLFQAGKYSTTTDTVYIIAIENFRESNIVKFSKGTQFFKSLIAHETMHSILWDMGVRDYAMHEYIAAIIEIKMLDQDGQDNAYYRGQIESMTPYTFTKREYFEDPIKFQEISWYDYCRNQEKFDTFLKTTS